MRITINKIIPSGHGSFDAGLLVSFVLAGLLSACGTQKVDTKSADFSSRAYYTVKVIIPPADSASLQLGEGDATVSTYNLDADGNPTSTSGPNEVTTVLIEADESTGASVVSVDIEPNSLTIVEGGDASVVIDPVPEALTDPGSGEPVSTVQALAQRQSPLPALARIMVQSGSLSNWSASAFEEVLGGLKPDDVDADTLKPILEATAEKVASIPRAIRYRMNAAVLAGAPDFGKMIADGRVDDLKTAAAVNRAGVADSFLGKPEMQDISSETANFFRNPAAIVNDNRVQALLEQHDNIKASIVTQAANAAGIMLRVQDGTFRPGPDRAFDPDKMASVRETAQTMVAVAMVASPTNLSSFLDAVRQQGASAGSSPISVEAIVSAAQTHGNVDSSTLTAARTNAANFFRPGGNFDPAAMRNNSGGGNSGGASGGGGMAGGGPGGFSQGPGGGHG
mgnify:CR=1 FL=1